MKRYEGTRQGRAVDVTVNGRPLNPRLDLWNHSPTGFEWGYGGIHYIAPWLPLALRPQTPEAAEQGRPPQAAEVEQIKVSLGQQEFALE